MSDQDTSTNNDQTQTDTSTDKEVTLDDVYREAGLDKIATATDTQQTTQQTTQQDTDTTKRVEPSSVPDPFDTENFKAFLARQAAGTTALEQAVTKVVGYLNERQRSEAIASTRADIEKAVSSIDEVVQLGKPKVVEAYLDGMVREDPRMKAIWDNRAKNPTAWNNALKIAAKKMQEDFSIKTDPNLVNSQRARKESQRQMATTSADSKDESWDNLAQEDFQRKWEQMVSGGH